MLKEWEKNRLTSNANDLECEFADKTKIMLCSRSRSRSLHFP